MRYWRIKLANGRLVGWYEEYRDAVKTGDDCFAHEGYEIVLVIKAEDEKQNEHHGGRSNNAS